MGTAPAHPTPLPPLPPLLSSVLAVLKAAHELHFPVNRTKLVKLLYFADLRAVETGAAPFTGATWRWRHYGPHDTALAGAENTAVEMELVDRIDDTAPFEYGACHLALAVDDIDDPLQPAAMDIVRGVVREFGRMSATALKDLSYQTPPMVAARVAGERQVLLDLSEARRAKQQEALLGRHRMVRDDAESRPREQGVANELVAETHEFADLRRRANREALGDR